MYNLYKALSGVALGVALVIGIMMFIPFTASAQTETGQITGKVTDPTGALVVGAKVTVKSNSTGAERTATTGTDGVYTVTSLQPGIYSITVIAQGFATSIQQQVQITVGSKLSVETQLSLTTVSAAVVEVVAGSGVEVNTQTQELSNVISGKQVTELPTITRNPYDLVALSGAVASDPNGSTGSNGVGYAINGQRSASTNILLDGADNNNTFGANVGQSVPLDSVQEFRVITSNFSSEYGRASGGIVNVATKSGTNNFHGSAYEFNRLSALSSNSFDDNANGNAKGNFTRNQFGYSLGGPVIKNKLLFFNSTEWSRVRSTSEQIVLVPTPQLLAASNVSTQNFFNSYQLANPINDKIYTVSDIVNSVGASSFSSTNAFALLPGNTPAFGTVRFPLANDTGGGNPQNSYQTVARVDYNLSDKTQIYGRYALENSTQFAGTLNYSPYAGFNTGQTNLNNNILLSLTRTITPNLVSQSKFVYNRLNNLQPLGSAPVSPTLYLSNATNLTLSADRRLLSFPGYSQFTPGNSIPFGGPQNLTQLFEDINWARGKHQFRFGGQYLYIQDNRVFGAYQNAVEILGANAAQGLQNLVLGQLLSFQAAVNPQGKYPGDTLTLPVGPPDFTRSNRYHDFALYANDSLRIKPRLTLNLGVRYEYFGVQHNGDPSKDSNFYFGTGSTLQEQIRNGQVMLAKDSPVGGLYAPDRNNFAPRLGFAWDVFGDGKTSLRGGYGIAYERNFGNVTFNVIQNPPNYAVISLVAGTDVPSIPITTSNSGPLAGTSGSTVIPLTSLRWVRPDIRTAYASFYSMAIQREISPRTVASLEYSGSGGRKLYSLENYNRNGFGAYYLGSAATRPAAIGGTTSRLNGQYTNINERGNGGLSRYNSLTTSIDSSNLGKLGLQLTAKYTYAVARDNLSSTFSSGQGGNFGLGLLDPFNPGLDYGYADFDIRHRFVSSFNWTVPYGKQAHGLARHLVDGWSMSGIFTARSGTPFTVYDCSSAITVCMRMVPTGSFSTSAGKVTDTGANNDFTFIDLSNQTASSFTDISGGTEVGPYPVNMTARNLFRGPGNWNLDGGIYKKFTVREGYELQFRTEFYNMFNHANLFIRGDQTDISGSSYVPAYRDGRRNIQFALKLLF